MLDKLMGQRAAAERRFDEAAADIPAAILDGDEGRLADLRRERRRAAVEADDLGEAIDLAAERERIEREGAEAARREEALARVRSAHEGLLGAADGVDEALAALELAVAGYGDAQRELERARREARLGSDGRFALKGRQNMRWATWSAAPTYAGLAEVPFANVARRRPLRSLVPGLPAAAREDGRG